MNTYIKEGLITGGDRAIDDVTIVNIRHANQKEFERIVLDIDGNKSTGPVALERPPYYQFDVSPEMKRIVVTVFGKPKLKFSADAVKKAFARSHLVKSVDLIAPVEKDRWTFVLNLAKKSPVEVFELSNPVRVILDIKATDRLAK
jgi:hypothetical protein